MGRARKLNQKERSQLRQAMAAIEFMSDAPQRQLVYDELVYELGSDFNPTRASSASADSASILQACIRLGALPELVEALRAVGGSSTAVNELARLVEQVIPPSILTSAERRQIAELLSSLPSSVVAQALDNVNFTTRGNQDIQDVGTAIDLFEAKTEADSDADLTILSFLEHAAHGADKYVSFQSHPIIGNAAGRLNRTAEIKQICQQLSDDSRDSSKPPSSVEASSSTDEGLPEPEPSTSGEDVRAPAPTTPVSVVPDPLLARIPKVMGGVPPRNPNFTGRTETLEQLADVLREHSQTALLPHTLQGLGGVGKTQLAGEYAHRFQSEYELIWWVHSDDDYSIERSLASLARRLGLSESHDVTFTVETLLEELRLGRPYQDWLLIYDGAAEPRDIRRYLASGPGQVLITSRSRSWINEGKVIEVDVFEEEESREFLMPRWTDISDDDAHKLASELGHLPLALDQAIAVHRETGMPLSEYRRLLKESPGQVLDEGETSDYPRSVAKTCQLAFEQLKERSLGAAQLLEICSFLSSHNIAIPMLVRGRGATLPSPLGETLRDDIKLRAAIRDIGRYALAQLDTRRDFIRIHMLVRALLRDAMTAEQRDMTERSAHEVLALANPGAPDDESTWPQHRQVAPHVVPSGVVHSNDAHVRRIVLDQIRFFFVIGHYGESAELAERAVETQCHLAKVDHDSLEVLAPGVLPAQPVPARHDRRL